MSKIVEKYISTNKTHWLQDDGFWTKVDDLWDLDNAIKMCDELSLKDNCSYRVRCIYDSKILYKTKI